MEKSKEYLAGHDCGLNGPNEKNCHYTLFSTPEKTADWERGKMDGEKDRLFKKPFAFQVEYIKDGELIKQRTRSRQWLTRLLDWQKRGVVSFIQIKNIYA